LHIGVFEPIILDPPPVGPGPPMLQESSEIAFTAPSDAAIPADDQLALHLPPQKWFEEDVRGLRGPG
jgi:hypothetical protein